MIHPQHRVFQHILWRLDASSPLQEYVLNTVTYAVSPALFLALCTLHQLAQDECQHFPFAADTILHDVYVDDIVTGSRDLESAVRLNTQLIQLPRSVFELHK